MLGQVDEEEVNRALKLLEVDIRNSIQVVEAESEVENIQFQSKLLKSLAREKGIKWPQYLSYVSMKKNFTLNRSLNDTAYHIVFGVNSPHLEYRKQRLYKTEINNEALEQARARDVNEKNVEINLDWINRKKNIPSFIPGDVAW
eukprot:snap_masked-scaffold_4-processed-gene-1.25-mRNA-1 protein AED:1.00 eAED:1.00 QI:0/0/0/0/1/1/3/0/143